ncbi:hypothetical protein [Tenacibaculum holothuriorum]|nr:hypothetical protein [Tenacibaculum holothuriorum]
MKKITFIFFLIAIKSFSTIYYVNPDATGDNSGTSWENAFIDLQIAINSINENDILYVKSATYHPSHLILSNDERSKTFFINKNIKIYGGFNGTETSLSQRNIETNPTILSGDFNDNDTDTDGNGINDFGRDENAYSVVFTHNLSNSAVLDGFRIINGNANVDKSYTFDGHTLRTKNGAGMYNISSNITLKNLQFINNSASIGGAMFNKGDCFIKIDNSIMRHNFASYGAGMYSTDKSLITITNSEFYQNRFQGGVIMTVNYSVVKATNCNFYNNSGASGGAFYTRSGARVTLLNVKIHNNTMSSAGGAIYNANFSSTTMYNTLIYKNSADFGGAVFTSSNSYTNAINCTVYGNRANKEGGAYYCKISPDNMNAKMYNTIVWGNTAPSKPNFYYEHFKRSNIHVKNSILEGSGGSSNWNTDFGADENNNLDLDPKFESISEGNENFALQNNSSGLNNSYNQFLNLPNGNNSWSTNDKDVYGKSRLSGSGVDIGAVESSSTLSSSDLNLPNDFFVYYENSIIKINYTDKLFGKNYFIYNLQGKQILKGKITNELISTHHFPTSIYLLKIDGYKSLKFITYN